jgi:EmrB/QacA subfamily drug resistance transporter
MSEGVPGDYRRTFAVLAVGAAVFALTQSMVSPILPLLQRNLHTDQNTVTWVITSWFLSAAVCTPILGRIGDKVGKKRVLVAVLIASAVGSVLAALATSMATMIFGRVILGASGGLLPLSFGIIREEFPRERVPGSVGVISSLLAIGGGVGLLIAGPIGHTIGYRWLFWIPAIVVLIAAVGAHFVIPESRVRAVGRINWAAAVLLSIWLVALLLAVSKVHEWGLISARVLALLGFAIVAAAVWVSVEIRSDFPLVDMRMMRIPAVWTTNLVAFLFGLGLYAMGAFLPAFLQTPSGTGYGFGASITESGLIALPQTVTQFLFGVTAGYWTRRFGARPLLIAGSAVAVPAFMILAFAHHELWQVVAALILMGAAFGLAFSAMSNIIVDSVPSHQTGIASGISANLRTVGGAIGGALMASVVTARLLPSGHPTDSGYTHGFAMLGGIMVLATGAGLLIPRLKTVRDEHQIEQAAMNHPQAAIIGAGIIVGDDPE